MHQPKSQCWEVNEADEGQSKWLDATFNCDEAADGWKSEFGVGVVFSKFFVGMCALDGGSGSLDPLGGWLVGGDLLKFGRFNKNSREIFNWKSPIHLKNLKHFVWDGMFSSFCSWIT